MATRRRPRDIIEEHDIPITRASPLPQTDPGPIEQHIDDAAAWPIQRGLELGLLRLEHDPLTGDRRVRNISGATLHTQGYAPPIPPDGIAYLDAQARIRRANEARVAQIREEEDRRRAGYPTLWDHLGE